MIFVKIFTLFIFLSSIISCGEQGSNVDIIAINNEFIENNLEQRMDVTMIEIRSIKNLDTFYTILNSIEEDLKQGENIKARLDSLILNWKSNFDETYSLDYFERVDRNWTLFKDLDNKKDSNQLKNLFYLIKYEMINRYLVEIDGPCHTPFNHKVITIIEPSSMVRVGEEVKLSFAYAALDSLMTYKVYLGGYYNGNYRSDLITDTIEVRNGMGNYFLTPKKSGDTLIEGVVEIMTKNGPIHYPFSQTIRVYK